MIDYHSELVKALETVLPTHYELVLTSKTKTPCISYIENDNYQDVTGDTLGYSNVSYTVTVWASGIGKVQEYATQIDSVLRPMGWNRSSVGEMYDKSTGLVRKVMNYSAIAFEQFN